MAPALRALLATIAVCAALLVLVEACGSGVDGRLERARDLTFEKKFQEAADEYRAILSALGSSEDRESARARAIAQSRLGDLLYLELGDPAAAADVYRRLILASPASDESFSAREKLADIADRHLGDSPEAIAQWQQLAASGRPGADRFGYLAAKGYFQQEEFAQARRECQALVAASPTGPWADDALFLAATAFQFEGKHDDAIAGFREVEKSFPKSELVAQAHFQIGQSQAALGKRQDALATYLEALADHPDPRRVQAEIARMRRLLAEEQRAKVGDLSANLQR